MRNVNVYLEAASNLKTSRSRRQHAALGDLVMAHNKDPVKCIF